MRKVFHERVLPQPIEKPLPELPLPVAPLAEEESVAVTDPKPLSYQPNYVRLNLKRHLNVKHPVHRRAKREDSTAKDEERVPSQQQLQNSGSGPGLLEEEVFDVLVVSVKSPEKAVPAKASSQVTPSKPSRTPPSQTPPSQTPPSQPTPSQPDPPSQATPSQTTPLTTPLTPQSNGTLPNHPSPTAPLCNHGIPAVLRTVKKAGKNHGREFYCCCHEYSRSCGFFLWKDCNRSDVISMIKEMPTPKATSAKEQFEEYWKEELENRSVDDGERREE